ncbi:MAG: 4Fe-4S dicluster domain-containing protein [Burkholderiales bacterium]|nr:4Fe-4S dicluster domain-containing protein [Burkholderiales bacterium]
MGDMNQQMLEKYRNNFLHEVEEKVDDGDWVKMCMQCGVCAGSCTFGPDWEHTPQKIFMMIRAGKREEVLTSHSMWLCTSCYSCMVRCPRKLPITHIMHGLASYAHRLNLAPKNQPTRDFSLIFWDNCTKTGRVNELRMTISVYFREGIVSGIKKMWTLRNIGRGLFFAKRLNPMELFVSHGCKDKDGLRRALKKADEIEARRRGYAVQPRGYSS